MKCRNDIAKFTLAVTSAITHPILFEVFNWICENLAAEKLQPYDRNKAKTQCCLVTHISRRNRKGN